MTESVTRPSADSIFIIEHEHLISSGISDALDEYGLRSQSFNTLSTLLRAARVLKPRAVVIDAESPESVVEPHDRMGCDHLVRVLRGAYPSLCIVVLAASLDRQTDALVREFKLPIVLKPFAADKLLAVLSGCGILLESRSEAQRTSVY
jgi:DNA-binding response OmpR family regulator